MDPEKNLRSTQIAQRLLSSLVSRFHQNAFDLTAAFFMRLSGTTCLLHPEGALKMGSGEFGNAVYDKTSHLTFFDLSPGHDDLLLCFLEVLHHADYSDPDTFSWSPVRLGEPHFVESRSKEYIDHGHGLFVSPPGPGGGRFLVSPTFAWTPVERRVFGNYAELHHLL